MSMGITGGSDGKFRKRLHAAFQRLHFIGDDLRGLLQKRRASG